MMPTFGTAAVLTAPPAPLLSTGWVPGNSLAAQHANFLFFHLTKELNNLLTAAGISQLTTDDTQVTQAVDALSLGLVVGKDAIVLSSGSPYSLAYLSTSEVIVTTTPYTVNLPAATGSGYHVKIVCAKTTAGLVTITPSGTDKIGPAGNVSVFLQNVDQSGAPYYFQEIELLDALAGCWVVVGGQYCPHQTVDTDGQQYHLGKLHHIPLGNTTDRRITGSNITPPGVGLWGGPYTAWGVAGVPTGAKAIRANVLLLATAGAAGDVDLNVAFSDNNSNTPNSNTGHPEAYLSTNASASGHNYAFLMELDIPLNVSGQFYIYTVQNVNGGFRSNVMVTGYYMGD